MIFRMTNTSILGVPTLKDLLQRIRSEYESAFNEENSHWMKKYMKNQFDFFGIKTAERRRISKPFMQESRSLPLDDLEYLILALWKQDERELQYLGAEMLQKNVDRLPGSGMALIEALVTNKSWWDTVDALSANTAGDLIRRFPALVPSVTDAWIDSGNMWLQRSALLFQLKYKGNTDKELLFCYIRRLSDSREFFIQKAIGWALREYSKTNPDDVVSFVASETLKPLSKREALKVVQRKTKQV